jgi:hypothetical protein
LFLLVEASKPLDLRDAFGDTGSMSADRFPVLLSDHLQQAEEIEWSVSRHLRKGDGAATENA